MIGPANWDVWRRPVGVITLADGQLACFDDGAKTIWRVSYSGRSGQRAGSSSEFCRRHLTHLVADLIEYGREAFRTDAVAELGV